MTFSPNSAVKNNTKQNKKRRERHRLFRAQQVKDKLHRPNPRPNRLAVGRPKRLTTHVRCPHLCHHSFAQRPPVPSPGPTGQKRTHVEEPLRFEGRHPLLKLTLPPKTHGSCSRSSSATASTVAPAIPRATPACFLDTPTSMRVAWRRKSLSVGHPLVSMKKSTVAYSFRASAAGPEVTSLLIPMPPDPPSFASSLPSRRALTATLGANRPCPSEMGGNTQGYGGLDAPPPLVPWKFPARPVGSRRTRKKRGWTTIAGPSSTRCITARSSTT